MKGYLIAFCCLLIVGNCDAQLRRRVHNDSTYASISNLVVWFDALKIASKSNGDTLGTWTDQVGGHDMKELSANAPKYTTNVLGPPSGFNKPAVEFTAASSTRMTQMDSSLAIALDQHHAYTAFYLVRNKNYPVVTESFSTFWIDGDDYDFDLKRIDAGAEEHHWIYRPGDDGLGNAQYVDCYWGFSSTDSLNTRANIFTYVNAAAVDSMYIYTNRTLKASHGETPLYTQHFNSYSIGADMSTTPGAFLDGYVGLVLYYDRRLSTSEIEWVWGKIETLWGLK